MNISIVLNRILLIKIFIYSYERFQVEECYNASSQNRKKRADQISEPKDINDLINISSDKTNAIHPIFRTLTKDDKEEIKTIATGFI